VGIAASLAGALIGKKTKKACFDGRQGILPGVISAKGGVSNASATVPEVADCFLRILGASDMKKNHVLNIRLKALRLIHAVSLFLGLCA